MLFPPVTPKLATVLPRVVASFTSMVPHTGRRWRKRAIPHRSSRIVPAIGSRTVTQYHLVFERLPRQPAPQKPNEVQKERDPVQERVESGLKALQIRVSTFEKKLREEEDVRDYLASQGKLMAVARVDRGIASIRQTLDEYRKDLENYGEDQTPFHHSG
jgi:hypothetical protein